MAAAGDLRQLAERLGDLGWRMKYYNAEDLFKVASALRGTAILIALDTGDMELFRHPTRSIGPRGNKCFRPLDMLSRGRCVGSGDRI
ncbi:hypothetical protein ACIRU3_39035 [Streptomyces sp. NPDC101151]|uniref:hypothetical protein n=1 Tax=Streptomyces sp. NPDC101151 TaxID=3366115 RepID=UPI003826809B